MPTTDLAGHLVPQSTHPPVHRSPTNGPVMCRDRLVAPEAIGPLLAGLRTRRGWSQPHLAARLCAAAGVPTVSRHEVSRWERQQRVPGPFWLQWLSVVLDVPLERLAAARFVSSSGGDERRALGRDKHGATTVGA